MKTKLLIATTILLFWASPVMTITLDEFTEFEHTEVEDIKEIHKIYCPNPLFCPICSKDKAVC
jgi:hypothetical protein